MVVRDCRVPDEVFQLRSLERSWHHLALRITPQRRGVADLPTEPNTSDRGPQIVWMRECIGFNLDGIVVVGSGQSDPALTLRPDHTPQQRPGSGGRIESGRCLGAADGYLSLTRLQIGSVEIRT